MTVHSGRHFLQNPGPANVPDRVLRAMTAPLIDHRGAEFASLSREILPGLRHVFGTTGPVVIYPSSGTGAWEAALVNTLSPGDRVLVSDTGHFAGQWAAMAGRLGLDVEVLPGDWRRGPDPDALGQRLEADTGHAIKAVLAVHSETSTGVTARIPAIRAAMDRAGHPALLLADTVSSLGSMEYRHDEWGVDVSVGGSQKGLMLPPGLGFNAISPRSLAASRTASLPRSYWDWAPVLPPTRTASILTPADQPAVRAAGSPRHAERGADGRRVRPPRPARGGHPPGRPRLGAGGGLRRPGCLLRIRHRGHGARRLRRRPGPQGHPGPVRHVPRHRPRQAGRRVFRIGHLGHFNDLSLAGTLCGVEMGLDLAGVPIRRAGVAAALDYLRGS